MDAIISKGMCMYAAARRMQVREDVQYRILNTVLMLMLMLMLNTVRNVKESSYHAQSCCLYGSVIFAT